MSGAVKCVMDGKMGVNRAADQYSKCRTTFRDRLSGRVTLESNPGPVPYLTSEEEDELVHSITSYLRRHWRKTISWNAPTKFTIWMNLECL